MSMRQRFRDWLHEREIRRLGKRAGEAICAQDTAKAIHFWNAMAQAIKRRSPAQVERMERAKGLR